MGATFSMRWSDESLCFIFNSRGDSICWLIFNWHIDRSIRRTCKEVRKRGEQMIKTVLLYESRKNNMGLPLEKLLGEYFTKEEVQDALRDIGEPTTGTKEELVGDLIYNWHSHNRDKYDLLDFIEKEILRDICYNYNLDATEGSHATLKRRIEKANLLGNGSKPKKKSSMVNNSRFYSKKPEIKAVDNSQTPDVHFHIGTITHSKGGKLGIALTVIGIAVSIIVALVV